MVVSRVSLLHHRGEAFEEIIAVDSLTGAPVPQARVEIWRYNWNTPATLGQSVSTGADGVVRVSTFSQNEQFFAVARANGSFGIDVDGFAVVKAPGDPVTKLPYCEIPKTRPTGFAMEHRDLVEGMRTVIARLPGVSYLPGTPVEEVLRDESGRAIGVRAAGETVRARLVLGCDGRHSKVRPLLGLSEKARLLSFSVAFRLPGGAPLLPAPTFGHIFLGAWGPMLLYPIGGHAHASDRTHPADARGCFDVTTELSGGPRGAAERLRRDYAPHLPPQLRDAMLASLDAELPQMVNPATGRVHTNYAQAVAVTGRLSSNDPNLQNIPIRTPEGRRVREAFVAPPGCRIASADYSQIELRIIAHMSGDHNMQEAFRHGLDIHAATAAKVFNVDIAAVTREQRSRAKAVNFGIAYGQGAFGLLAAHGIEVSGAQVTITDRTALEAYSRPDPVRDDPT